MKNTEKMLCICTVILALSVSYSACLTTEESGVLLCVEQITSRHFTDTQPLVISMPGAPNHTTGHGQADGSEFEFVDNMLENTHNRITWPVLTSLTDTAVSDNSMYTNIRATSFYCGRRKEMIC